MKVQYIGNSDYPPTTTECFGYTFELNGPAVEVKGEAMKLAHNKTFRVVNGTPVLPDDMAAEISPRKALEAAGVRVDSAWDEARIRAELEALYGPHG